jgi:hypothetical protein
MERKGRVEMKWQSARVYGFVFSLCVLVTGGCRDKTRMLDGQTSTNRTKHGKTSKVEIEGCGCDQRERERERERERGVCEGHMG